MLDHCHTGLLGYLNITEPSFFMFLISHAALHSSENPPAFHSVCLLHLNISFSCVRTEDSCGDWTRDPQVPYVPKEAVEVSVPHVLEHHGQRLSVCTHTVEPHDVLVLEHRQKLRLPLEVLPGRLVGVLQRLRPHEHQTSTTSKIISAAALGCWGPK